jgi:TetR/AcrR family transcriptional regulator, repressor for lfrA
MEAATSATAAGSRHRAPAGARHPASGARHRTAILDAAYSVLSRRPSASLADVAAAAAVGRTTLHRYFGERSDLVAAMSSEALQEIGVAIVRARPGDGDGRAAMIRICRELCDLGDLLTWVFTSSVWEDPEWQQPGEADDTVRRVVRRGHADGSITAGLSVPWVENLLWAVLYSADAHVRDNGGSRHDGLAMAVRSLDGALTPRPGDP